MMSVAVCWVAAAPLPSLNTRVTSTRRLRDRSSVRPSRNVPDHDAGAVTAHPESDVCRAGLSSSGTSVPDSVRKVVSTEALARRAPLPDADVDETAIDSGLSAPAVHSSIGSVDQYRTVRTRSPARRVRVVAPAARSPPTLAAVPTDVGRPVCPPAVADAEAALPDVGPAVASACHGGVPQALSTSAAETARQITTAPSRKRLMTSCTVALQSPEQILSIRSAMLAAAQSRAPKTCGHRTPRQRSGVPR